MPRLRLFLFWLLAFALPLQGVAATAIAVCPAMGQALGIHGAAPTLQQPPAAHEVDGGHAGMHHGGMDHASMHDPGIDGAPAEVGETNLCGASASCCQAPALAQQRLIAVAAPLRYDIAPAPLLPSSSRTTRLPDKPPRA